MGEKVCEFDVLGDGEAEVRLGVGLVMCCFLFLCPCSMRFWW